MLNAGKCRTVPSPAHKGPLSSVPFSFFPVPLFVFTPVNVNFLEVCLDSHPDRQFVDFILLGLNQGFRLGYTNSVVPVGRTRNLLSVDKHKTGVAEAILKELNRGHTVGPFNEPPTFPFHSSPLGAVPKKDGSVRLILDLSCPRGQSINEGIFKEDYSVVYSKFDDAVDMMRSLGPHSFMAKIDTRHAFRICPVHPIDWGLLGYCFDGRYFMDTRLPFGGRSSPFIFNAVAQAFHWIIKQHGILHLLHYLDDFFLANKNKNSCSLDFHLTLQIFNSLGVPIADDKLEGPAQVITYLGLEIDMVSMCIRLARDELLDLKEKLGGWISKKNCTKRELLSLIGSLPFACKD